ncbi:methylthioribose-1-phosphate isomerase [Prosthecobacter fusiformis]|uniref:Methylthioribose-1-phosphate isomerase n=1 Tax=Prosthecobacter fusiformis TaxID=48464 RepID=A0A4R7SR27_9BACT|nr:S-methyl-5-thioribose-1-phosphate isomerase [Prosthecobacter fusiformis]TDU81732.1 methylthioribose-1-phosphate isomerase [Prosthecobacter fusiformis]
MLVSGIPYRTIWLHEASVRIIDQRRLPWTFDLLDLHTVAEVAEAIRDMAVRGAGLIGATAGYGMWLAAQEAATQKELQSLADSLISTRPTAVNLSWAVNRQLAAIQAAGFQNRIETARITAETIADEDAASCAAIGQHGLEIIQAISARKPGQTVQVLTHCNAGWLAFVDHGSATAPIYAAHAAGIPIHVWVDETRPRNQGARLTAWELAQQGVPHTVIADNTGGHLMQQGMVDLVITGADRVTRTGDVANKIGTYLKALAAMDNGVPFYVALPSSTFDWTLSDGVKGIPIEQRAPDEVTEMEGITDSGSIETLRIVSPGSAAANYAFDVTPARLVTGLITEKGLCSTNEAAICALHGKIPNSNLTAPLS